MKLPPPNQLIRIIERHDREACAAGIEPRVRSSHVIPKVCRDLGIFYIVGPIQNENIAKIEALYAQLYRKKDRAVGAVFSGIACHLDLFFTAYLPIIYGTVKLDPRACIDAEDMQWSRIQSIESEYKTVLNQICDVWDIGACLLPMAGYSTPVGDAGNFFRLACNHMEAATAVACTGARLDGAVMSALLCAELSVKCACMISAAVDISELRQEVGHNLCNAKSYIERDARFSWSDFHTYISILPPFVESRYSTKHWSRLETKAILLAAQGLLAKVAIGCNKKSIRDSYPI